MNRVLFYLAVVGTVGAQPSSNEPQEISGLLMDAACSVIAKGTVAKEAAGVVTVREKYRDCKVTSESKSFAIHAEGRLYVVDSEGNAMIRQQMSNEAFRASMSDKTGHPKWLTVTVMGITEGSRLRLTSVRR